MVAIVPWLLLMQRIFCTYMSKRSGSGNCENLFCRRPDYSDQLPRLLFQAEEQITRGWPEVQIIRAVEWRHTAAGRPVGRKGEVAVLSQLATALVWPQNLHSIHGVSGRTASTR